MIRFQAPKDTNPIRQEIRARQVQSLLENEEVRRFLLQNNLSEREVEKNPSLFSAWLKWRQTCRNCTGLDSCCMDVNGFGRDLAVDEYGALEKKEIPCRYKRKQDAQRAHMKNFLIAHYSPNDALLSFEQLMKDADKPDVSPYYRQAIYSVAQIVIREGRGAFVCGQPGTGKSWMLKAAANLMAQNKKTCAFVSLPRFSADMKASMKEEEYRASVLSKLRRADFLVLDDMGAEMSSAWFRDEILLPLLDWRMEHGKTTCFTSNSTLKDLEEAYNPERTIQGKISAGRLMERVRALAQPVECKGSSWRYRFQES